MIRVLVVDDSPVICTSLAKSIGRFGDPYAVSGTAGNGVKALEWLERHFADVCITDIRMPVMDGLSLVRQINERYPWMVSMIVSSYDEFEFAQQSIALQALDYILKPVDDDLLREALDRAGQRIGNARGQAAAQVLLRKLPQHRDRVEKWTEHIRANLRETMPLLIVDTLELLEAWTCGRYELLRELARMWMQVVIDDLDPDGRRGIRLDELPGAEESAELPMDQVRFHFRLGAVRILEEGANHLIECVHGGRNYFNVRIINEIKNYVRDHCHEDIQLQDLADHVALNKSYMATLFRQETGVTIWNYIVSERMAKARDLLLNTNLKIYEIAERVGYDDISHFSHLFKKRYGLTPLDYKRRFER